MGPRACLSNFFKRTDDSENEEIKAAGRSRDGIQSEEFIPEHNAAVIAAKSLGSKDALLPAT